MELYFYFHVFMVIAHDLPALPLRSINPPIAPPPPPALKHMHVKHPLNPH